MIGVTSAQQEVSIGVVDGASGGVASLHVTSVARTVRAQGEALFTTGADWILNGEKCFIANGSVARLFLIGTRTNPNVPQKEGGTMFAVPVGTPGMRIGKVFNKSGWRFYQNAELIFENCRVPHANVVGEPHKGQKVRSGVAAEFSDFELAANALGICDAAVEYAMVFAKKEKRAAEEKQKDAKKREDEAQAAQKAQAAEAQRIANDLGQPRLQGMAMAYLASAHASLGHADQALYYAKSHGRNLVCHYDELIERGLLQTVASNDTAEFF